MQRIFSVVLLGVVALLAACSGGPAIHAPAGALVTPDVELITVYKSPT